MLSINIINENTDSSTKPVLFKKNRDGNFVENIAISNNKIKLVYNIYIE